MLVVVEGLYHHHEITGEKLSLSYQIITGQKLSYCNILYTTICCNFGPGEMKGSICARFASMTAMYAGNVLASN